MTTAGRIIAPHHLSVLALATLLFASTAVAQPQPPTNAPRSSDHFATVNGIKLNYVDWGGAERRFCF